MTVSDRKSWETASRALDRLADMRSVVSRTVVVGSDVAGTVDGGGIALYVR